MKKYIALLNVKFQLKKTSPLKTKIWERALVSAESFVNWAKEVNEKALGSFCSRMKYRVDHIQKMYHDQWKKWF